MLDPTQILRLSTNSCSSLYLADGLLPTTLEDTVSYHENDWLVQCSVFACSWLLLAGGISFCLWLLLAASGRLGRRRPRLFSCSCLRLAGWAEARGETERAAGNM
jgi:hypothetical protein